MTAANPPVLGGVAPYLSVSNADKAAGFYMKAFGASEVMRAPPDEKGRYLHIHLVINGGSVMLADAFPDHGHPLETPGAFMLHLQVDDVDAWWKRAVDAGAEVLLPVSEMFWGPLRPAARFVRRQVVDRTRSGRADHELPHCPVDGPRAEQSPSVPPLRQRHQAGADPAITGGCELGYPATDCSPASRS
jgi:uncharacterized glyoxalase superfamily protein PhnB